MGVLEDKFGVPPFSILDTKQKYWTDRKKEWLSVGIDSELGRNALSIKTQEWVNKKELTGLASKQSGVSIFDPVLCELLYKWFCPPRGKILDPFAGGSVRGIVASVFGYIYTGVDLRQEQIEANNKNIEKLSINLPIKPKWICGDSVNIDSINGRYDMIMSCPPYHDLEKYSENPNDLSNMDYDTFIKKYREIIKKSTSMLNDNRFAVFVVGEIRDKKGFYKNFVGDTIQAFLDAGMMFYNDMIIYNQFGSLPIRVSGQFLSNRKIGKVHQNVLVFYKGDVKMIKPMDIEANKFIPINEIKIELPVETVKEETDKVIEQLTDKVENKVNEVEKEIKETKTICDLCGADFNGMTYEEHEKRPFHQDRLN